MAFNIGLRGRAGEVIACAKQAAIAHEFEPGTTTVGTDNGTQFTSRRLRQHHMAQGIIHRRGGYCATESQAFTETWFGQSKKRCAQRAERKTPYTLSTESPPTSIPATTGHTPPWPT